MKVTQIKNLKGESSVSIRKGKKIISYDYNIKLKWEMEMKDGDGNSLGVIKGEYELPEVSNLVAEEGDDWEIRPSV